MPGAGSAGLDVFSTRRSSTTSSEADTGALTMPGVVTPTAPVGTLFVKLTGTPGVVTVAVKLTVTLQLPGAASEPAGMLPPVSRTPTLPMRLSSLRNTAASNGALPLAMAPMRPKWAAITW